MTESRSLRLEMLPTFGLAIGALIGGLLGAGIGSLAASELETVACYVVGFLGGAAAGLLFGRRWQGRYLSTSSNLSSEPEN